MDKFGLRIIGLMAESGMDYEDFVDLTGISKSSLENWVYKQRNPHARHVVTVAKAFDVSCDWLLGVSNVKRRFGA